DGVSAVPSLVERAEILYGPGRRQKTAGLLGSHGRHRLAVAARPGGPADRHDPGRDTTEGLRAAAWRPRSIHAAWNALEVVDREQHRLFVRARDGIHRSTEVLTVAIVPVGGEYLAGDGDRRREQAGGVGR